MPDPSVLTDLGRKMLAELPPQLRGSWDYMAAIHAYAKELELLEDAIESLRPEFNPATAVRLLPAWEWQLKLPVGGAGADVPTRQARAATRLQKVLSGGTGAVWVATVDVLIGPGWSYLEHDPADPSSPAPGIVEVTVPFATGDPRFAEAGVQIRDITDAHIELEYLSSSGFTLDLSALDETQLSG